VNATFRLETATKKSGFDLALGRTTMECLNGQAGLSQHCAQHFEKQSVELKGYDKSVRRGSLRSINCRIFFDSAGHNRSSCPQGDHTLLQKTHVPEIFIPRRCATAITNYAAEAAETADATFSTDFM